MRWMPSLLRIRPWRNERSAGSPGTLPVRSGKLYRYTFDDGWDGFGYRSGRADTPTMIRSRELRRTPFLARETISSSLRRTSTLSTSRPETDQPKTTQPGHRADQGDTTCTGGCALPATSVDLDSLRSSAVQDLDLRGRQRTLPGVGRPEGLVIEAKDGVRLAMRGIDSAPLLVTGL